MNTINYKQFDFTKLQLVSNGKNFYMKYDGSSFELKMKSLQSNFHITDFKSDNKFKITSQVNQDLQQFLDKFKERLIELLLENKETKKITKLKLTKEILQNVFNDMYKLSNEPEKWKPTFNLKLMNNKENSNNFNLLVFDEQKKCLSEKNKTISNIKLVHYFGRKTRFSVIVNPYFYFINKSFGVSFQTKQLRIIEKEKNYQIQECSISDDEQQETEEEESVEEEIKELVINI